MEPNKKIDPGAEEKSASRESQGRRKREVDWPDVLVGPAICLLLSILVMVNNLIFGVLGLIATAFLLYHSYRQDQENRENLVHAIEELDVSFDSVTKNAVFGMPFPMAVLNEDGNFLWYNSSFKETLQLEESVLGKSYQEIFPKVALKELLTKGMKPFRHLVEDRIYLFYHNATDAKQGKQRILLYGVDNTEDEQVRQRALDEQMVVLSVIFDNYDEVRAKIKESDRPIVMAQVDRLISAYAQRYEGLLVKYESDRYLMVLSQIALNQAKKDKFSLLESVREIVDDAPITPTVSIGIGYGDHEPYQLMEESRQAIDIALSRGGDQVVLKNRETLDYYGGKTQATERYTKVKARVMANTIRSFIEEASNVLILPHQNPDMDAYGSALGMLTLVENLDRKGYIVLDEVNPAIENLYNKSIKDLPDLKEKILFGEEGAKKREAASLIVVVDNHRHDSVSLPDLLDHGNRIIIVDHHRRGAGYISNAEVSYIEPYASSASELVTELFSYTMDDVNLPQVVAEGLLAGITVDTKNFFYQTGTRTFEAAAFLKRQGADSIVIKQLFKDDYDLMRYRSEIITSAEPFDHHTMIGTFPQEMEGGSLIASQAADDLLNIRGVDASFVLTPAHGKIHISGRSLGDVSVQLIMEKLGGGGHLTVAATQMPLSMEEAKEKLKEAIREYMKEEEDDESNPA